MNRLPGFPEWEGIAAVCGEPLCRHCTFRIGGNADVALFPATVEELIRALDLCAGREIHAAVIGGGSNVLFADEGFRGAVIFTGQIRGLTPEPDGFYALCGTPLPLLSAAARERGLSGAEFACGIPGTVGGAVRMNAGAHGGEMSAILSESDYYDVANRRRAKLRGEEHRFGYRTSIYADHPEWILLGARIRLRPSDRGTVDAIMRENRKKRRESQPLEFPSAGSAFKRPQGTSAALLIDRCGLKGRRVGGAEVSEKHAGFIINRGGATAADVLKLEEMIRETVLRETGVILEPEICLIR